MQGTASQPDLELRDDGTLSLPGKKPIRLSDHEARFLRALQESAPNPRSYGDLNRAVYGDNYFAEEEYLKNTVPLRNVADELRKKLRDGLGTNILANERGLGYCLTQSIVVHTSAPVLLIDGTADAPCPYRGLKVFREADAASFAGRAAFAAELHRRVDQANFVALVGSSGSGKSSVVRAGLIPRLRCSPPSGTAWGVLAFAPGENPFFSLASELIPLLRPDLGPADLMSERRKLALSLADRSVPMQDPLDDVRRELGDVERLLVVVDQFEEVFTLTPHDLRPVFADALLQLAQRDSVCVVLTLRADFYGHAISLSRALSDQLGRVVVNLGAMTRDELRQAVVEPAANVGLRFEPGLVETILEDVGEQAGALPLLEFALQQLWVERLAGLPRGAQRSMGEFTLAGYRAIGGVSGALAKWAQAVYDRLRVDERAVARRVLLRLVVPGDGTNHTRQRVPMADLPRGQDARQVERVVQVLADARLLTTSTDALSGARSVEISHEALIRGWDQFAAWIETERDWLREHRRLTEATRDWLQRGDDELLYRGSRLADVAGLLAEHTADLSPQELDFLGRSARLEARRERARYLGQAAGGAVGVGLGYGIAFALGFATTNPGPNALILTSATFVFLLAVGQATGFAIGVALWLWRASAAWRPLAAALAGGLVGMGGYLLYLRFLVNAEPTWSRPRSGRAWASAWVSGSPSVANGAADSQVRSWVVWPASPRR